MQQAYAPLNSKGVHGTKRSPTPTTHTRPSCLQTYVEVPFQVVRRTHTLGSLWQTLPSPFVRVRDNIAQELQLTRIKLGHEVEPERPESAQSGATSDSSVWSWTPDGPKPPSRARPANLTPVNTNNPAPISPAHILAAKNGGGILSPLKSGSSGHPLATSPALSSRFGMPSPTKPTKETAEPYPDDRPSHVLVDHMATWEQPPYMQGVEDATTAAAVVEHRRRTKRTADLEALERELIAAHEAHVAAKLAEDETEHDGEEEGQVGEADTPGGVGDAGVAPSSGAPTRVFDAGLPMSPLAVDAPSASAGATRAAATPKPRVGNEQDTIVAGGEFATFATPSRRKVNTVNYFGSVRGGAGGAEAGDCS